jgi:hypothetical protein
VDEEAGVEAEGVRLKKLSRRGEAISIIRSIPKG